MSELALAQASVLAALVRSPPAQLLTPRANNHTQRSNNDDDTASSTNAAVTGLSSDAAHARAFRSGLTPTHITQVKHAADTDFSAILMDSWISDYLRERNSFDSVSLFCEIKLRELLELTNSLAIGAAAGDTTNGGEPGSRAPLAAAPSKVRTAVCIDLFDILIASVIHPDRAAATAAHTVTSAEHTPGASRQALGYLLMKLRDELVKSIYVQPVPAHLLLQYQSFYEKRSANQLAQLQQPIPPPRRKQGQGSSTARRHGRHSLEEKAQDEQPIAGSLTHRARLLSNPAAAAPAASSQPPSSLRALLDCVEYFSLIPQGVARNHSLAAQARIVMIPSKLFRLRQIQKKVVAAMTSKWRGLLLAWKFWEWREITRQSKRDKQFDRGSRWATKVTSRIATLEQRVVFLAWKATIARRKNLQMKNLKFKGLASNRELQEETARLQEETTSVRDEIARLDTGNNHLAYELRMLKAQLEHSQVDLQDGAKHQAQCSELLDALRAPLNFAFAALGAQTESFASREFASVYPLIQVVVDSEFQSVLEPLAIPASHGVEHWALSIAHGSAKQRMAVCAQIVARWLALQLKLCTQVLSGGAGNYSEYLVKNENQQRIAAALARIRQLCSSNPPTSLPSFPVPAPRAKKPAPVAGVTSPPMGPGGSLMTGRSRARATLPPPAAALAAATPAAPADAGDDAADDAAADAGSPSKGSLKARGSLAAKKKLPGVSSMVGKIDDLPPASSSDLSKIRRLNEARSQAIPTGTLSTPQRVFAQLRDADRPESVLAVSAMLMHSDDEVARSLRLTPERRWLEEEKSSVQALRALMDTLRVTPEMTVSEMDVAVKTVHTGIESQASALARARSAASRLAAVEDEVFAQSVKLLHQQSQRKHRHGERENNMPTDLLDLDLSLYTDIWFEGSTPPAPVKAEVTECNRLFEEYCRDLYKIFVYYAQSHNHLAAASSTAPLSTNLLAQATQGEPRLGNTEFWRFVRDAKLKLQATALIDQIYARVSDRSGGAAAKDGAITDTATAADLASKITLATDASSSAANLLAASANGLSLSEAEAAAEAARVAGLRDLGFKQFGETLVRLALVKFPQEKLLHKKIKNLLMGHVLPNSSANALKYHKTLLQASIAANAAGSTGAGGSAQSATTASGLVNLSTLEVDAVFRKWSVLLKQIFGIYARITPQATSCMTFNDFLGFAREFELLHKFVTQHDLKQLFANCIKEGGAGAASEGGGGGADAKGDATASAAASSLAATDKAIKLALKRQSMAGGGGMQPAGADDDDEREGAPSQQAKELTYRQFLELLAAVSHYVIRNPYYSLHDRVEKFILSALASRKKLPSKVFRSAI